MDSALGHAHGGNRCSGLLLATLLTLTNLLRNGWQLRPRWEPLLSGGQDVPAAQEEEVEEDPPQSEVRSGPGRVKPGPDLKSEFNRLIRGEPHPF